jgi:hypothetical protein
MSGDPTWVWACLVGGMLLQLSYMVLPFQRWDWARYLLCVTVIVALIAKLHLDHTRIDAIHGLAGCGLFTALFALLFQERLLPRLGEGMVLMWTTVFLCVIVELSGWQSATFYWLLGPGLLAAAVLFVPGVLPNVLKLVVYAWFLLVVVAMGVLQFRASDFSVMASGQVEQLDYRFAFIDGMAGAYIGVHVVFLFELLPIPGKGEKWSHFVTRWRGYIGECTTRFDNQRLRVPVAAGLVLGIAAVAYCNHRSALLPDRTLANLVLVALPIAWRFVSSRLPGRQAGASSTPVPSRIR